MRKIHEKTGKLIYKIGNLPYCAMFLIPTRYCPYENFTKKQRPRKKRFFTYAGLTCTEIKNKTKPPAYTHANGSVFHLYSLFYIHLNDDALEKLVDRRIVQFT